MDPRQLSAEIERMSIAQRLLLTQDIWDSIAREADHLPMPEWQKRELESRYRQYQKGELTLHDCDSVHNELRTRPQ